MSEWGEWIRPEGLSALFAGVSIIGALGTFGVSERRLRKEAMLADRRKQDELSLAEKRHRDAMRLEWTSEVLDWGRRTVAALSRSHELAAHGLRTPDQWNEKRNILASLSGLADEGRFFFENTERDRYERHKQQAYSGLRPDLLTYIVRGYQLLQQAQEWGSAELSESIIQRKRDFVSELQTIIDPGWLKKNANSLLDRQVQEAKADHA